MPGMWTVLASEVAPQSRRPAVPVVHVRITRDGVTAAQKAEIVADITATLGRVLGKKPEHTHLIIEEIDPENWGFAQGLCVKII